MTNENKQKPVAEAMLLEHITGPLKGGVTWLKGPALEVSLSSNRILHVSEPGSANSNGEIIAQLQSTDGTYNLNVPEDQFVWVNGIRTTSRELANRDMIEFGETGPLTRFHLYQPDSPARKMVGQILFNGIGYLRVSRKPLVIRILKAFGVLLRQLLRETTVLFRLGVLFAIVILLVLAYQQNKLNTLMQARIESGATKLEGFATTLARAREEALTPGDLNALSQELGLRLTSATERLDILEERSEATARVISSSMSSVVFLQGSYGFRDVADGRLLRHVVNTEGIPLISPFGHPLLTLDGEGPIAERQFTGTAFVVSDLGVLVTNRHVALPWEKDANIETMASEGLEPVMTKYIVYIPDYKTAHTVEVLKASDDADLAILRITDKELSLPGVELAEDLPTPGDEIIVMGYPTGLRTMLAQSGEDFIEELQEAEDTGFWSVAARLAEKGHISPLSSRGIISQATSSTVVYDAETTHGGSGGPVLDLNGRVVAVNAAILPEYGGSNLGVPVAEVWKLIRAAGLQ